VSDRRISAAEVNRYVNDIQREITDLEQRLQSLRMSSGGGAAAVPARRGPGRPPGSGAKKSSSDGLTPERRASRQLQGRYLGLIRQIPAGKRAQYTKIAKERGREAAIREMQSVLGK
jgi:hypothetical protein